MDGNRVLAATKRPTSEDVNQGVQEATRAIIDEFSLQPSKINAVMISTTHFKGAGASGRWPPGRHGCEKQ